MASIPATGSAISASYKLGDPIIDCYHGELWKARFLGGKRQGSSVVLRIIDTSRLSEEELDRLEAAAAEARKLDDECIVPLTGVCEDGTHLALESATFDGLPLHTVFECADGPIDASIALRIVSDIVTAVGFIHYKTKGTGDEQGRFGGLMPNSFVVCTDGKTRMLEPGLAGVLRSMSKWSLDPRRLGYDAAEVLQVGAKVDASVDLFSVGVILWELLHGKRLFTGGTLDIVKMLRSGNYPRVDANDLREKVELEPKLAKLLDKALAKDRSKRFKTPYEMASALTKLPTRLARTAEFTAFLSEVSKRRGSIRPPSVRRPPPVPLDDDAADSAPSQAPSQQEAEAAPSAPEAIPVEPWAPEAIAVEPSEPEAVAVEPSAPEATPPTAPSPGAPPAATASASGAHQAPLLAEPPVEIAGPAEPAKSGHRLKIVAGVALPPLIVLLLLWLFAGGNDEQLTTTTSAPSGTGPSPPPPVAATSHPRAPESATSAPPPPSSAPSAADGGSGGAAPYVPPVATRSGGPGHTRPKFPPYRPKTHPGDYVPPAP